MFDLYTKTVLKFMQQRFSRLPRVEPITAQEIWEAWPLCLASSPKHTRPIPSSVTQEFQDGVTQPSPVRMLRRAQDLISRSTGTIRSATLEEKRTELKAFWRAKFKYEDPRPTGKLHYRRGGGPGAKGARQGQSGFGVPD